jgi:hypothetical protein
MTQNPSVVQTKLLLLRVPRTNDKKELAAEQMFASIHGLLLKERTSFFGKVGREHLSFEIAALHKQTGFYIWLPTDLVGYIEEQVYAQYPSVQISEVEDYLMHGNEYTTHVYTELVLQANDVLPIKTFPSFEVDPLAAITASLAKLEENERAVVQFLVRPVYNSWYSKAQKYATNLQNGSSFGGLAKALMNGTDNTQPKQISPVDQARIKAAEEKSQKLAYETKIRIIYEGNVSGAEASMRLQAIVASFKQFNSNNLNGFTSKKIHSFTTGHNLLSDRIFTGTGFACNIEEVASLYHLPHTTVETPFLQWASSRTAEPPANLPIVSPEGYDPAQVSPVAVTNFRGGNTTFGLPRSDRGRHLYIIGQTGVGKSGLLELLTISDVYSPYGFAVIDPHGDYAINTLRRVPPERAKDVVYFNPADTAFPIAFNPMEVNDANLKTHTASELIGVLKRMFDSWGPRLEYILRYTLLALLDYPNSTMLDITRMLTEKSFRNDVLNHVQDPVVKNFWLVEFASWNDKFATEAVAPVLNKVGAFTANPIVRNIVGQPKSSFNIRQIMDERKILIVNLSRGLVGEDNAALLGALLVTKIQLAAMSRADIDDVAKRVPFYLYVDEFQNFATDSFATILSEARKYGLCLTVANQYIAQMTQEVRDAVFGNVGSTVAFRMGADDARVMQRYFEPRFEEHDLVHMNNRNFVISLTIGGEKVQAFSATSLNLPPQTEDNQYQAIVEHSRSTYSSQVKEIEDYVQDRYIVPSQKVPSFKKASPATPQPVNLKEPTQPSIKTSKESEPNFKPSPYEVDPADRKTLVKKTATEALGSVVVPTLAAEEPIKKKRKRTRRRKKKLADVSVETTPARTATTPNSTAIEVQPDQELARLEDVQQPTDGHIDGDGTIHLR